MPYLRCFSCSLGCGSKPLQHCSLKIILVVLFDMTSCCILPLCFWGDILLFQELGLAVVLLDSPVAIFAACSVSAVALHEVVHLQSTISEMFVFHLIVSKSYTLGWRDSKHHFTASFYWIILRLSSLFVRLFQVVTDAFVLQGGVFFLQGLFCSCDSCNA